MAHITLELLQQKGGIALTAVPYKGDVNGPIFDTYLS
jgi:hypothetical protein